jgi:hypothetical protein
MHSESMLNLVMGHESRAMVTSLFACIGYGGGNSIVLTSAVQISRTIEVWRDYS